METLMRQNGVGARSSYAAQLNDTADLGESESYSPFAPTGVYESVFEPLPSCP